MVIVEIKKLHPDVKVPQYAHEGDAGFDLCSREDYLLSPGLRYTFMTGLELQIPQGYVGSIRDRSGHAHKNGLHVLAGVIDSNYRGEIGIVLINLGDKPFAVEKDMRIAQMLIQPVAEAELIEVETLEDTVRNQGGFGSTGT